MQTKKRQGGFTLIELMIVVTIIGILASIAVPAYRDYTIRTRVGECATIFSILKTGSSIYYSENGAMPDDLGELSDLGRVSGNSTDYVGDYVSAMEVQTGGDVLCTLKDMTALGDDVANGGASNGQVLFNASVIQNVINWGIEGVGSMPTKYLPANI